MPTNIDAGRRPAGPGPATSRGTRVLIIAAVAGFAALHVVAGAIMHAAASPVVQAAAYGD